LAFDPSCDDEDLKEGAKLEIPLWLTKDLAARGMIKVERPSYYGPRVKNDLQADPRCVNLGEKSPYFYDVGLRLLEVSHDPKLAELLSITFQRRYQQLLISALSVQGDTKDIKRLQRVLSAEEKTLTSPPFFLVSISCTFSTPMGVYFKAPMCLKFTFRFHCTVFDNGRFSRVQYAI